jgi:hypothetical protein
MASFDLTILTDSHFLSPGENDPHGEGILLEDQLVMSAMEKQGLRVNRINWDHPRVDWRESSHIMFRSTWDYFERFPEFAPWLERVKDQTSMVNPYETIRWNLDKHYLQDLADKGINIPPTIIMDRGEQKSMKELCAEEDWKEIILKPLISGGARHTYRFFREDAGKYESIYRELISGEAMMIQEFQVQVPEKGELSFVMIGGRYSHAVLKKAQAGDFRVQDEFGGTLHSCEPTGEEIVWAEGVLASCEYPNLYARVDGIWDNQGRLALSELELIEPELWFRFRPEAADRLAEIFLQHMQL